MGIHIHSRSRVLQVDSIEKQHHTGSKAVYKVLSVLLPTHTVLPQQIRTKLHYNNSYNNSYNNNSFNNNKFKIINPTLLVRVPVN